jgi:hypothetical protein
MGDTKTNLVTGTRVTAACQCGHRVLVHDGRFDDHVVHGELCPGSAQSAELDMDTIVQHADGHWSLLLEEMATHGPARLERALLSTLTPVDDAARILAYFRPVA